MKKAIMLIRASLAACLMWANLVLASAPPGGVDGPFALIDAGKHREALVLLEKARETAPTPEVLWGIGLAAFELGEYEKSLDARLAFARVNSDWRGMVKLVQTYQALGRLEERDKQRTALVDLWTSGANPELSREESYRREQFRHEGRNISAFEHYRPAGTHRVVYAFEVAADGDKPGYRISLGSYDTTNTIAQELGDVPKGKRMYHLDQYGAGYHETLGFYIGQPSYDVVRAAVLAKVSGTSKPMSRSTYKENNAKSPIHLQPKPAAQPDGGAGLR
ncbi:hypothetical protein CR152_20725 [Massilia violaceinigra]|uniref:Tetratricopeptide repeat protein n=2 Tax=Massilia violaceinigra TaxID=2045208 RepID=A0A2D2DNX5_9BURK|nr:hypothetical protein CR152_20725 [Massilia violaceinigra]